MPKNKQTFDLTGKIEIEEGNSSKRWIFFSFQIYRSNSSILGQKMKNQKKNQQKLRRAARRASEGDTPSSTPDFKSDEKSSESTANNCGSLTDTEPNDSGVASSMDEAYHENNSKINEEKKANVTTNKKKNKKQKHQQKFQEIHNNSDLIFNLDF